jgi:hypothetical protein
MREDRMGMTENKFNVVIPMRSSLIQARLRRAAGHRLWEARILREPLAFLICAICGICVESF